MKKGYLVIIILVILCVVGGCLYLVFGGNNEKVHSTNNDNGYERKENNENNEATGTNTDYFVEDITLNDGHKMPVLGIGTFQLSNSQAENSYIGH